MSEREKIDREAYQKRLDRMSENFFRYCPACRRTGANALSLQKQG